MKKALIYGITGQDGYYLYQLLLEKGYEIIGVSNKESDDFPEAEMHVADLSSDEDDFLFFIEDSKPDEVYNLAAISNYDDSSRNLSLLFKVNTIAPIRMMECILKKSPKTRILHALSAYMYSSKDLITEDSIISPTSPYGISKASLYYMMKYYRNKGVFCAGAILFNHESPVRPEQFVTRKITKAAVEFKLGLRTEKLTLGNINARKDWGFAGDYVEAMWLMLQQPKPDDYIIATSQHHSVRDLCEIAFGQLGLDWKEYVTIESSLVRPDEASFLADISKARKILGWSPKVDFNTLIKMMVESDLKKLQNH